MDDWLLLQQGVIIYISLFLLLLGGAVGLPIPEDLPLILAGILLQAEKVDAIWVFPICYIGVILGDLIVYFVGRRFGTALFKSRWLKNRVPPSRIKYTRLRLEKRSVVMIFLARHLFYFRTVTFLTCGAVRMSLKTFLLADLAAALISLPLMIGLGYIAAQHYETVLGWFERARSASLVVLIVVGIGGYIYYLRRKAINKKLGLSQENEDSEQMPDL